MLLVMTHRSAPPPVVVATTAAAAAAPSATLASPALQGTASDTVRALQQRVARCTHAHESARWHSRTSGLSRGLVSGFTPGVGPTRVEHAQVRCSADNDRRECLGVGCLAQAGASHEHSPPMQVLVPLWVSVAIRAQRAPLAFVIQAMLLVTILDAGLSSESRPLKSRP